MPADLNLHWADMSKGTFYEVAALMYTSTWLTADDQYMYTYTEVKIKALTALVGQLSLRNKLTPV